MVCVNYTAKKNKKTKKPTSNNLKDLTVEWERKLGICDCCHRMRRIVRFLNYENKNLPALPSDVCAVYVAGEHYPA